MNPYGIRQVLAATLRRRSGPLARLAAWSVAEALPALLAGALTARAVDEGFLAGRPMVGFAWLGLLGGAVLIGAVGTRYAYRCLGEIVEPFRDELAQLVVGAALRHSTRPGAGPEHAAVARLTHQVEVLRDTFAGLVMVLRGFLFTAGAALLGLFALDPIVAGLVAVPLVTGLAIFAATLPAMISRQRAYVQADDRLGLMAGTVLSGHRDVVAAGAQETVASLVDRPIDDQAAAERALARMAALRSLTLAVSGWLPLGVLLALAPGLVDSGLTAGTVLGALVYICTALQPALRALVVGIAGGGLRFAVTLERVLRNCADPPGSAVPSGGAVPPVDVWSPRDGGAPTAAGRRRTGPIGRHPCAGAIGMHGVTFRYGRAARPVLADFDLSVPDGDHLAVVGPSGSGKSTLVALMSGLLVPEEGRVCLAGRPVAGMATGALARARVLIPQEAYVFSDTLAANVRYLRPDATVAELDTAIDRVGLRPLATRLGGLDAPVRPDTLSAGERQLIAAARAYLAPSELVILDEATSHLDPGAEAVVERTFADRPGTLVVVAHRLSSARRARRVLLLEGERAVLGRHEELLRTCRAYRDLMGPAD